MVHVQKLRKRSGRFNLTRLECQQVRIWLGRLSDIPGIHRYPVLGLLHRIIALESRESPAQGWLENRGAEGNQLARGVARDVALSSEQVDSSASAALLVLRLVPGLPRDISGNLLYSPLACSRQPVFRNIWNVRDMARWGTRRCEVDEESPDPSDGDIRHHSRSQQRILDLGCLHPERVQVLETDVGLGQLVIRPRLWLVCFRAHQRVDGRELHLFLHFLPIRQPRRSNQILVIATRH